MKLQDSDLRKIYSAESPRYSAHKGRNNNFADLELKKDVEETFFVSDVKRLQFYFPEAASMLQFINGKYVCNDIQQTKFLRGQVKNPRNNTIFEKTFDKDKLKEIDNRKALVTKERGIYDASY